ncbi:MAG TPA: FAD binding domain-containing protein [Kofleriaceae bacterium]|nr:FAD binding domain-containing protein [Kofleriaceae bacterium]
MSLYVRPADLGEALRARFDHPDWMVLAGGTDLMVDAPRRAVPTGILDLWRLSPLVGIETRIAGSGGDASWIRIGAGTTWRETIASPTVQQHVPILASAAREIGALQIQARGTVGGNLGTSSPVGDSLPVWLALDAELELASVRGARRVRYADYCTGYRKTALAADELIVAAWVPVPSAATKLCWRKVGTRRAQSISKVMAAAAITIEGGTITAARIGLGAVADRPIRAPAAEAALVGKPPGPEAAAAAAAALGGAIRPINDVRSTADYRLDVARNVVARFVLASY